MAAEVSLEFMTGNPQLGVLSGRLNYINPKAHPCAREKDDVRDGAGHDEGTAQSMGYVTISSSMASNHLPNNRGTLLCILSVPAHMIPTDMLQFIGPFKKHVHFVRILRPCNPAGPGDPARTPADYMVLLQMESQVWATTLQ